MRSIVYLSLLSSLLHTSTSQSQDESPSLPRDASSLKTDIDTNLRRRSAIAARLRNEDPMAVKKMAADPGAMFFPAYWGFRDDVASSGQAQMLNSSIDTGTMQPAILPIFDTNSDEIIDSPPTPPTLRRRSSNIIPRIDPFSLLSRSSGSNLLKRAFNCPSGTDICSNINRADACCPTGLTCNLVSGSEVGCCADGSSCAGQLSSCPAGYTECSTFGGGCCIPGYECVQGGCIQIESATVVVRPSTTSTSSTTSSSTPPPPPPTTTSTSSPSPTTTSSSTPPPTTTSSTSTTASVVPPARPTSAPPSSSSPSPSPSSPPPPAPTTSSAPEACPTGFYQCSAYYNSGACCQVGRDCGLTSCPASSGATVLASNGVTVGAPAGAVTAGGGGGTGGKGTCAKGWFSCNASVGGGCCPTGFNCGTASCWINATAQATGGGSGSGGGSTGSTSKEDATSGAGRLNVGLRRKWGVEVIAIVLVAGLFAFWPMGGGAIGVLW